VGALMADDTKEDFEEVDVEGEFDNEAFLSSDRIPLRGVVVVFTFILNKPIHSSITSLINNKSFFRSSVSSQVQTHKRNTNHNHRKF